MDLNLLIIFDALWRLRSVTQAARELHLGQPAMSAKLKRLREAFHDPLFVREPRGLTPTPRAIELAPFVADALGACRVALVGARDFAPQAAQGTLTIAGTDYSDLIILPKLLPYLANYAPGVKIVTQSLRSALPKRDMIEGRIDLAIGGSFGELPEGFLKQKLFDETYLCVARRNHPHIVSAITQDIYLKLAHVLISPAGDLGGVVDEVLAKKNLRRNLVAGIGNFHAPGEVIAASDFILTAPGRLIHAYAKHLPLTIYEPPFKIPGFSVAQVWHERTAQDPLHLWLRGVISQICSKSS